MTQMEPPMRQNGRPAEVPMRAPNAPAKNGAARPAVARAMGQQVQLNGLAQVVGLAIGAPEFQRR
jgi:hypothetical protein